MKRLERKRIYMEEIRSRAIGKHSNRECRGEEVFYNLM
ncbi:hypothetical protein D3OALGA1CA_268 [Olavius algarvensis associated proteobacterium Delta 3]|nr:hypothetical protein D3OALGA1CA_268 [Olavius algarvensis associated proteobacterium Delta 3]CAB5098451.1 hypothetical protein D3OALGB2SA_1677 [Olavius algarvensis associated proteobacterium Delta 3]